VKVFRQLPLHVACITFSCFPLTIVIGPRIHGAYAAPCSNRNLSFSRPCQKFVLLSLRAVEPAQKHMVPIFLIATGEMSPPKDLGSQQNCRTINLLQFFLLRHTRLQFLYVEALFLCFEFFYPLLSRQRFYHMQSLQRGHFVPHFAPSFHRTFSLSLLL